uniref:Methyltransferase-like protein n=1 Tax=Biomphalaria glabrata TaxID=6526 RepID=A0A2C9JZS4_BIOGL
MDPETVKDGSGQIICNRTRELSLEEQSRLLSDTNCVSEFKQNKLELEAQKNWDLFYKRNTTKFFKDRHWTKREFEELASSSTDTGKTLVLFEVGCGVGNFIFPLLEDGSNLFVFACDFSQRAVDFVKSHSSYDSNHCTVFQADITKDDSTATVPMETVDIATMIFVLSAIHPDKMIKSIINVAKALKPGGHILIRDYGLYDHAMLRFSKGHKLSDCFYVRQDGTRAYYFSLAHLSCYACSVCYGLMWACERRRYLEECFHPALRTVEKCHGTSWTSDSQHNLHSKIYSEYKRRH